MAFGTRLVRDGHGAAKSPGRLVIAGESRMVGVTFV